MNAKFDGLAKLEENNWVDDKPKPVAKKIVKVSSSLYLSACLLSKYFRKQYVKIDFPEKRVIFREIVSVGNCLCERNVKPYLLDKIEKYFQFCCQMNYLR